MVPYPDFGVRPEPKPIHNFLHIHVPAKIKLVRFEADTGSNAGTALRHRAICGNQQERYNEQALQRNMSDANPHRKTPF
jgi:hypothetical protein